MLRLGMNADLNVTQPTLMTCIEHLILFGAGLWLYKGTMNFSIWQSTVSRKFSVLLAGRDWIVNETSKIKPYLSKGKEDCCKFYIFFFLQSLLANL